MFGAATNASGAPRQRAYQPEPEPSLVNPYSLAGFVPYAGDGYAMLLPGKWNPSKEREFAGIDVR